jgi:cation diffusion facilitator family transporter
MDKCCNEKSIELRALAVNQKRVLWAVLFINILMFLIEGIYGLNAQSTSLLADSLDMLGDAFVYGVSLFVIGKTPRWNASVSLLKGIVMALFGLGVIAQAIYRFFTPSFPLAEVMGWVGGLALIANFVCAILLLKHRNDDINMRSTWLCSRNDVIVNLGVLAAAGAVALTQSKYPDLLVGVAVSALVLRSAFYILKESLGALRNPS